MLLFVSLFCQVAPHLGAAKLTAYSGVGYTMQVSRLLLVLSTNLVKQGFLTQNTTMHVDTVWCHMQQSDRLSHSSSADLLFQQPHLFCLHLCKQAADALVFTERLALM